MPGEHFTLEQLRPGLQAILDQLSSCNWEEVDSCLYGSFQSHSRDVARLNDMRRIKDAFPKEIWDALKKEERSKRAEQLRREADRLEASMASEIEEIEAILREHLTPHHVLGGRQLTIPDLKLPSLAAAIAAHRSKDREDGAREMRERAAEAARHSQPVPADRERYALNEAARAIRALPLTTRTEGGDA